MAKILIVDDEPDLRQLVRRYAAFEGYETAEAADGLEAVAACRREDFDLVVMDAMMPGLDGFSACKEIQKTKDIPVLMLSARGEEYDKLFGFEVGADDYVVKPFSPKELMVRIRAILARCRRGAAKPPEKKEIALGRLRVDEWGREVYVDGERVLLTGKEYDLLLYLIRNKGIVLGRERILEAVWGYDNAGAGRTVDWQIKCLRSHLGPCRDSIVTIRGAGYKFEA